MAKNKWFWLQLFAGEGGGAGAGTGASAGGEGGEGGAVSGVNDGLAAEDQRLRELGVPEEKLRKRAQRAKAKLPEGAVRTAPSKAQEQKPQEQVATAEENPTEDKTGKTTRMSWDEIMADPEYNKKMQETVQSRLRGAKGAEDALGKLTPALELLARKHGQDPAKMDYEALAKAISDDESYYEDKALEMGVSVKTAMQIDKQERDTARRQRQEQQTLAQLKLQRHFQSLEQQGEAMKKVFPGFDLRKELQNPAFVRMTHPDVGISVEDAYYAVHRNEIMAAGMQVTAQKTAQKISNSIQAGSRRPQENGTSGQAPSVTTFDYRKASPEQRKALKDFIRSEAARGRKVYPGNG